MGSASSVPPGSHLCKILADWSTYSCKPMTKKRMKFCCNFVWPMYILENEERWSLNGSLNYYTILQPELFCHRRKKTKEVPYVQAFMKLHNKENEQLSDRLMVQREKKVFCPRAGCF